MAYINEKDVVFAFIRKVDYNQTWEEIEYQLGYDFSDYRFGKRDGEELRRKIKNIIKFMKIEFDGVFNNDNNTQ